MFRRLAVVFLLLWPPSLSAREHDYSGAWAHPAIPAAHEIAVPPITLIRANQINLGDVFAFTGNNTHSGTESFSNTLTVTGALNANGGGALNGSFTGPTTLSNVPSLTTGKINNIVYIDGTTNLTLTSYLASPSANTTVIVSSNQTISTSISYSVANLVIKCENNAVITFTSSGRLLSSGAGDGDEGCNFQGPGTGVTLAGAPFNFSGGGITGSQPGFFRKNTVSGFGPTGGNGIVEFFGASHWDISNNFMTNNADTDGDIFVNNIGASTTLTDFRIRNNDVGEVIVHATGASSVISNIDFSGNLLHAGQNSKTEFCAEFGAFGGTIVQDITSSHNTCRLASGTSNGGISFSTVNNCTETGDIFDANGFAFTSASFEHVILSNCTISGTVSILGSGGLGLTCDRCTNSSFTGNTVVGGPTASTSYGIHIFVSNTTSPNAKGNAISGNTIILPASGTGHGIWVQCNVVATCANNNISGNTIVSDGTAGSQGITVESDVSGTTVTNNTLGVNTIIGPQFGINLTGVSGGLVTNTTIVQGTNTAATPLTQTFSGGTTLSTPQDTVYGTYRVTTDQTITAGASLTAIPGLSWTMPANTALNVQFACYGSYSQATAAASDSFGIQDVTVAPTNIFVNKVAWTSTAVALSDNTPTLTTTTATAIGAAFTPSAATTVFNFEIAGEIEQPSNASTSVVQIMAQFTTNNGTIKRGTACRVW